MASGARVDVVVVVASAPAAARACRAACMRLGLTSGGGGEWRVFFFVSSIACMQVERARSRVHAALCLRAYARGNSAQAVCCAAHLRGGVKRLAAKRAAVDGRVLCATNERGAQSRQAMLVRRSVCGLCRWTVDGATKRRYWRTTNQSARESYARAVLKKRPSCSGVQCKRAPQLAPGGSKACAHKLDRNRRPSLTSLTAGVAASRPCHPQQTLFVSLRARCIQSLRASSAPQTMVKAVQAEESVQAYFDGLIKAGAQAEVRR